MNKFDLSKSLIYHLQQLINLSVGKKETIIKRQWVRTLLKIKELHLLIKQLIFHHLFQLVTNMKTLNYINLRKKKKSALEYTKLISQDLSQQRRMEHLPQLHITTKGVY